MSNIAVIELKSSVLPENSTEGHIDLDCYTMYLYYYLNVLFITKYLGEDINLWDCCENVHCHCHVIMKLNVEKCSKC